jgi:hypothetical protein
MKLQRIPYSFSMRMPAPADWTYRWVTDYQPGDFKVMGLSARRKVERLAPNLILLSDTFDADPFGEEPGKRSVKVKLVHLYPRSRSWSATHISGPARYSQFLYRLTPTGAASSRFDYSGAQVERTAVAPTSRSVAARAQTLRAEDVEIWQNLRREIARERR